MKKKYYIRMEMEWLEAYKKKIMIKILKIN